MIQAWDQLADRYGRALTVRCRDVSVNRMPHHGFRVSWISVVVLGACAASSVQTPQHNPQQYPPQYPPQQPYPQPPRPRRRTGRMVAAAGGGLAALVLAAGGGFAAGWSLHPDSAAQPASNNAPYLPFNPGTGDGTQSGSQPGDGSQSGSQSGSGSTGSGATDSQVAAVAAKVDPALVDIDTVLGAQNAAAAGTGIVLTSDGIVLTNNHVVAGATSITVTDIGNHKAYRAAVIGYDRSGDIAVLQLSGASGLATATLAPSTAVKAGDPVVAIGNAGGTGGTPSAVGGVVSATGQSITASDESTGSSEQLTGLIEVNAAIEAGDSGDSRSFAGSSGPTVLGVVSGSPAQSAGLTRGDVITSIAGTSVDSATALTNLLDRYHPGNKVKLAWTDVSGQPQSASITLATGPVG